MACSPRALWTYQRHVRATPLPARGPLTPVDRPDEWKEHPAVGRLRIGHLKLEPPGATDRLLPDSVVARLGGLGVFCGATRHAIDHRHLQRRSALKGALQLKRLAVGRRDAPHRAARAPTALVGTLPIIEGPRVLVVRGLVADDRLRPPQGVHYPRQPERNPFGRHLL